MLPGTNSTVVAVTVRMSPSEAAFGTPIPERREPKDTVPGMPTASSRKPWLSMPARNKQQCVCSLKRTVCLYAGEDRGKKAGGRLICSVTWQAPMPLGRGTEAAVLCNGYQRSTPACLTVGGLAHE